jgi:hypothetical protein
MLRNLRHPEYKFVIDLVCKKIAPAVVDKLWQCVMPRSADTPVNVLDKVHTDLAMAMRLPLVAIW